MQEQIYVGLDMGSSRCQQAVIGADVCFAGGPKPDTTIDRFVAASLRVSKGVNDEQSLK